MRVEKKPEQPKPEKFIPDQPLSKVIILAALVIASTALFWLAWHNVLTTGISLSTESRNIVVIVSTLLAFCLMFSLLALTEVLVTRKLILLITAVLAAGTVFVFFTPSLWSFFGFLLMVLSFLYWRREVGIDMKSRSKFIPQKTIGAGLRFAVILVLLASSFVFYSHMVTGSDARNRLLDGATKTGSDAASKILSIYYQDKYSPDVEIDEFIANITAGTEGDILFKIGIEEIDEALNEGMEAAKADLIAEARNDFLSTFEIQAQGTDKMSVIIEKVIRKNVEKYVEPYVLYIPALFALALFFALNIFGFIYRELIKSFSFIIFHILVWLKFIKVKKVMVEAEKVSL